MARAADRPVFLCDAPLQNCHAVPIDVGLDAPVYLELFGTGISGGTNYSVTVGGQSVPVLYAGQTPGYAGLDQVDISIPKTLAGAGDVRVYLVADGAVSNVVVLKIQ